MTLKPYLIDMNHHLPIRYLINPRILPEDYVLFIALLITKKFDVLPTTIKSHILVTSCRISLSVLSISFSFNVYVDPTYLEYPG